MKVFKKPMTLVWIMIFIMFFSACKPGAQESDLEISQAQHTEIAQLSTQVADLERINQSQWEAISHLATEMPFALGVITPIPSGVTITPTAYVLDNQKPDPTSTPLATPAIDIEYPSITRTGIDEIDKVIDTILSADVEARIALVHFTTSACTTADGLGGPPKCEVSEPDGTLIEAFPVLSSEGSHVRPAQIEEVMDFAVGGLLAVYQVPDDAFQSDSWPAGEYGLVFSSDDGSYPHMLILLVENGQIVRLDSVMGRSPFDLIRERSDKFILPPLR